MLLTNSSKMQSTLAKQSNILLKLLQKQKYHRASIFGKTGSHDNYKSSIVPGGTV